MDGWEFLEALKQIPKFKDLPVIVQSGLDSPENFERGLQNGAFYFVSKPVEPISLLSMIRSSINEHERFAIIKEELRKTDNILSKTKEWKVTFRSIEEALSLSKIIAKVSPDPERMVTGLCELLINSVEHGIARISYDEKTELQKNGIWMEEIQRRLALPENINKTALLSYTRTAGKIAIFIQDPGPGFRWQEYIEISKERMTDSHGRGIAIAKALCFDSLEYSGRGNEVTVEVNDIPSSPGIPRSIVKH